MKLLLIGIVLLPLAFTTTALADTPPPTTQTTILDTSTDTSTSKPDVSASQLGTDIVSAPQPIQDNSDRFNQLSEQINQNSFNQSGQRPNASQRAGDLLNLPEGMIIRGSRGGLQLGTEL